MKKLLLFVIIYLVTWLTTSQAQTISYPSASQNLTVCSGESLLTAQVTGATPTETLSIQLPPGVEYVASSFAVTAGTAIAVEGGTPNAPTFALTMVSTPFTFTIARKATCASYTHALGAGTFKDAITIGATTENDPLVNFYQVSYPTITVAQPPPLNNVAFGSTHTRNFTFQNNGQGCLDTAYLEIDFGPAETTPNGNITADGLVFAPDPILSSGSIYVYKIFGTPTFAGGLCDTDPPISVSQPITVNGCSQNPTAYQVGWGCDYSSQCQTATSNGNITVQVTIPNLTAVVTPSYSSSQNCAGSPYATITAVVTNTGNGGATNVGMVIGNFQNNNTTRNYPYVVDTASIQVDAVHPDGVSVASNGTKLKQSLNTACSVGLPSTAIVNPSTPISIPVNGSITVTWDVNICPGGGCDDAFGTVQEMGLELNYTTECGVAGTKAAQGISNFGIKNEVKNVISQVPAQVIGGSCFSLKIDLDSDLSPSPNESYMEVTIPLPVGMSVNNLATDITENLAGNQMHTGYPKQVGQDIIARFTPGSVNQLSVLLCTSTAACGLQNIAVDIVQAIDSSCAPNELKTRKCISIPFDVVCPGPCASGGVVPVDWSFARSSYGLPDNNQNGVPETTGSVDLTKIDVNRYQAGDTLRSYYKGYVRDQTSPGTITNWNNILAEWKFASSTWRGAYANVTIQRGATTYIATAVPITAITPGSSFICNWASATFTPALPATYIQDDSVTVEAFLIWSPAVQSHIPIPTGSSVLENVLGEGPVTSDAETPQVDILTHTVYAAQTVPASEVVNQTTGFTCFIPDYNVNLLGDRSMVRANIDLPGSASGCGDKTVGWRSYARRLGGYHKQQYFLFEFRPMRKQDSVVVTIPAGWEYAGLATTVNSKWRRTRKKGSSINQNINTSITTTVTGNSTTGTKVKWDLKNAYDNNIMAESTEGSQLEQRFILRPSCSSPATVDITVEEYGFWSHYPDTAGNPRPYYTRDVRALNYSGVNKPDVVITNNSGVVQATSINENYWDVQLTGGNTNNAPNVWLAIEELASSNLTVNRVEHPIGTTITASNNYGTGKNLYQINAAGLSNPSFEVVRIYFSKGDCAAETLKVRAGWDCDQFPTNADSACASNDITLTTTSASSEIQLFKTQEPVLGSTVDICQPINYELRLRSTQNGDIDNPILNIIPPPGMQIVANIFTYSYPGNNNPETFTVPLVSGSHALNLEDHTLIDTTGIPGVNNASNTNQRTAYISYQLEVSSCNFVSGSTAQFEAKANGICGNPATGDGLIVNANPVRATPQAPTPSLGGTLTANTNFVSCSTPTIVTSTLSSSDGATYVGDSIFYYIPSPLQIRPGSFIVNSGVVSSSTVGTNQIKLELPANASNAPSISFEVESTQATLCDTTYFDVQSEVFRSVGIDCPVTFGNCQFAEKFDADTIDFQVKKPNLNSQNFTHNQLGNTITYSMDINNSGNDDATAGDYLVNIYCGDTTGALLHSFINSQVNASAMVVHAGSFTYSAIDCPNGTASLYVQIQDTTTAGANACICSKEGGVASIGTPLPVQLVSFDGLAQADGSNKLYWTVAQEINLAQYELQRANEQNEYETVTTVQPKEGTGRKEYVAYDKAPTGKDYYRLRMIDFDNKVSYSEVVTISNDNINQQISLYPNPTNDVVNIKFISSRDYDDIEIQIMDAVGKVINNYNKSSSMGTNVYPISVKQLASGTYFIRVVINDNMLQQLKFTKIN